MNTIDIIFFTIGAIVQVVFYIGFPLALLLFVIQLPFYIKHIGWREFLLGSRIFFGEVSKGPGRFSNFSLRLYSAGIDTEFPLIRLRLSESTFRGPENFEIFLEIRKCKAMLSEIENDLILCSNQIGEESPFRFFDGGVDKIKSHWVGKITRDSRVRYPQIECLLETEGLSWYVFRRSVAIFRTSRLNGGNYLIALGGNNLMGVVYRSIDMPAESMREFCDILRTAIVQLSGDNS